MAAKTTTQADSVLNTARGTAFAAWTPYVALYTAAPSDAGGGTEATGGSYARQSVTFGAPSAFDADTEQIANTNVVTFSSLAAGTYTHYGILDAATAGTLRYWGALDTSKTAAAGDSISFAVGALIVRES